MSAPYRDQDLCCPGCRAPLRIEGERLVCDGCGGELVSVSELTALIGDSTKLPFEIAFTHERASELRCPRCAGVLSRCRIDVRFDKVHAHPWRAAFRCGTDGVWFPAGRYARFIALVERKAAEEYKRDLPGAPPGLFALR